MGRRSKHSLWVLLFFLSLLTWSVQGCMLKPGREPSTLTYKLPTKITVAAGEALPGTDIRYEYMDEKGAHILINGQEAIKRKGDSLDWRGSPVPGVSVDLSLRVVWYTEEELYLVGTAKVVIQEVNPRAGGVRTSSPIKYSGPVVYNLAKGAKIPGSTVSFEGQTEEGAKLGGIEGYPYRKVGDSIFWEGQLRDDVYIRLDVRVIQFDERGLRVGGLVTLWLGT
ncbi:MAG: hypothetical protein J7M05_11830 [Anaerolineae bacterium]|nr:hypothetical protein [Anaerolineae bacterium]